MKNLTTLFAVLTLTLMSCKKEAPIVNRVSYEATVFVDAENINYTSQAMYKNEVLILDPNNTRFNTGDILLIEVKNTSHSKQDIGIELSANHSFIKGNAKHLEPREVLRIQHTF